MATAISRKSAGQLFALVFGLVYLAVGIVGFAVTGTGDGALLGFDLNVMHNLVHIALGAAWIVASRTAAWSKTINAIFGAVLLLVALLGFANVIVDELLLTNVADNVLHLVTGGLSLYFGLAGSGLRASAAA